MENETSEKEEAAPEEKPLLDAVPSLTVNRLADFITAWCDGKVFSSWHMEQQDKKLDLLPVVFMPIALGALGHFSETGLKDIGLFWQLYGVDQNSRSINGMPIFHSMNVMSVADWSKAIDAINDINAKRKKMRQELEEQLG